MSSPVLSGLSITMTGTDLNRTYPRDIPDLFDGGQLVWVGRYRNSGRSTVRIEGKVAGERTSHEITTELASSSGSHAYDFVEKLWAVRRVGFIIDQIDLHGQNKELTDELVSLSTKYGILTPYTSFLADERTPLHALSANRAMTTDNLHMLSETTTALGIQQRADKKSYQSAMRAGDAPMANAPAASGGFSRGGGLGGGMGGMGGGMGGMGTARLKMAPAGAAMARAGRPASAVSGPALGREVGTGDQAAQTMRQVGGKTFFFKDKRWVDAAVKPADEAKAVVVEQFSDSYFDLARKQSAEMNQYLTFEEPVTVELGGKVYRIERPKAK